MQLLEWEWILMICIVVTLMSLTFCACYCWNRMREPQTEAIDLSAFDPPNIEMQQIEPAARVEPEISAFDAHMQEIQRTRPAARIDQPPSYEEATCVGLRQRTSRDQILTPEDVTNAGRDETDVPGSSSVGVAGPSTDDSSKKKKKDKITALTAAIVIIEILVFLTFMI